MALIAETLVEEWLNRSGYFTIRGVKVGNSEIDLLAVSPHEAEGLHVEVSVSTRPMAYIGGGNSAKRRTQEEVRTGIDELAAKKYHDDKVGDGKIAVQREALWPDLRWRFVFVHGLVKYDEELQFIADRSIELVDMRRVLTDLRDRKRPTLASSSEASDVVELLSLLGTSQ